VCGGVGGVVRKMCRNEGENREGGGEKKSAIYDPHLHNGINRTSVCIQKRGGRGSGGNT